jgi:hypothetical protein
MGTYTVSGCGCCGDNPLLGWCGLCAGEGNPAARYLIGTITGIVPLDPVECEDCLLLNGTYELQFNPENVCEWFLLLPEPICGVGRVAGSIGSNDDGTIITAGLVFSDASNETSYGGWRNFAAGTSPFDCLNFSIAMDFLQSSGFLLCDISGATFTLSTP